MIVLSRKIGEQIVIDSCIGIKILSVECGGIKLGIVAPPGITVDRQEVQDRCCDQPDDRDATDWPA